MELLSFGSRKRFACRRPYFSLLRQRKVSKRKARVPRQVSASRPSYFLLLRQKKVTKEKASQRPSPCGVPCATRGARGRTQTRYAQTSARPDPRTAALLSTADGLGAPNTACARSLRSPCTGCTRVDARRARALKRSLAFAPWNATPPPYPHQAPSHRLQPHRFPIVANNPAPQPNPSTPLSGEK